MASPPTTHVIEIETGIGEPAFLPLALGTELQPISVGKKGMWRIASPRVLDVHAFLYFDGVSLFLQSADEESAASVDGDRVGKSWSELHAPCIIEIGDARLRFRSIVADSDGHLTLMAPATAPLARTSAQRTMQTPPPPAAPSPLLASRNAGRPFEPGKFSSSPGEESTRVAPLDTTSTGRPGLPHPKPSSGRDVTNEDDLATRFEGSRSTRGDTGGSGFGLTPGGQGSSGPSGTQPITADADPRGSMQRGSAPPGMQSGGGGYVATDRFGSLQSSPTYGQSYPNDPGDPGGFAGFGGGTKAIPAPRGMRPGPSGGPAPQGLVATTRRRDMQDSAAAPGAAQRLVSILKAQSIPKIVAGVLFVIGGVLYLTEGDEPETRPQAKSAAPLDTSSASADPRGPRGGGTEARSPLVAPLAMTAAPPAQSSSAWPASAPCPPPNWPPKAPLPCTPNNVVGQGPRDPKDVKGSKDVKGPKDTSPPLRAGAKTLERQAVDHVAAGETAKAAATYEELARRNPNNKVFAEAARILRAKLDAGVP